MTPQADIISTRYTKSAIKSCAALSYVEAQARMDDRFSLMPKSDLLWTKFYFTVHLLLKFQNHRHSFLFYYLDAAA